MATDTPTGAPAPTLSEARQKAVIGNMISRMAEETLTAFRCPACGMAFVLESGRLACAGGHTVPIHHGIPDFTGFSTIALEEKRSQAEILDDETGEPFDQIVLRPYDGSRAHVGSWLYHLNVFQRILRERLEIHLDGLSVLNCGCGGGFEAQFLVQQGARVTGFDFSQLRAEAAATRFDYHGLDGFFYRGDAALLPFPDNQFDLVLYHDSLHHVPIEEIPRALREAARVAKKAVVLLEAHDSPLRMFLESLGLSTSIEQSGNYVFRFRKSLMEFFALQTGTRLLVYRVSLTKKEHRARYYAIPIVGNILYGVIRLMGFFLRPLGNEACIILGKAETGKGSDDSSVS